MRTGVAICIAAMLLVGSLGSQTTSTEILGLVADSTGSVVPGAKVAITRVSTGETRTATTNQAGEYTFPLIEIGAYTVRCEMQGFKTQTVNGLMVEVDQKARVNFRMELGAVTETVEVVAQAVALKTDDATVGQVIDNKRVTELPLNGRNLSQLAVLVAGVQYGSRTGLSNGQGGFPIPGASISVIANGKRELTQTVSLDGVDAKEPRTHITVFTPSIEAIEEFKIQTSSYSAEYGQGGGARIEVSMKSGTNRLHGTVFDFLRNDKLDAENFFLNFGRPASSRLPKDRLRRNQFGVVLSGPVLLPHYNGRNKTFWAFDYEGRRETGESVSTTFFPPLPFRGGDFSSLLNPAINPATGRPFRGAITIFDPQTGTPFLNNIIPQSRLHPGALNMLQFIPAPQLQNPDVLAFNMAGPVPQVIAQNQFYGRVDHTFRDSDRVFARIALDRSDLDQGNINPNFRNSLYSHANNLATQWIHTFTPTVLNELRFGLNFATSDTFNPRSNTNFNPDSLGIGQFHVVTDGNRPLLPAETGIPILNFSNFSLGDTDTGSGLENLKSYQFADSLSLVRGKHNFKTGAEHQYIILDRRTANVPRGTMTFGPNESGYDFASFMLGYPTHAETPTGRTLTFPEVHRWGAYFLDDWKATSRLTLNLGLRWDAFGVPVDRGGYWRVVDFTRTYTAANGATMPTLYPTQLGSAGAQPLWKAQWRFFQPRLGMAFRPSNKWVIRAGGGWFANVEHMNNFSIFQLAPPKSGSLAYDAVTVAAGTSTRQFTPGSTILTLDNPFGGAPGVGPQSLLSVAPDHKSSDHWQWSFDVQRELPLNTALTIAYVGSKTTHSQNSIGNYNSPDFSTDTNFQHRRPYQQFYDALSSPNPQILGPIRYIDSTGNGFYDGLQATVEKRFSHGLSYGMAYVFSKAWGDGPAGGNEEAAFQNPRDRLGSRGRYFFDQRHTFHAHFVYELPFAKSMHGVAGGVLKGWQVNGILTLHTGFPFSVTESSTNLNTGANVRPDRMGDGRLFSDATIARWFDTTAFQRVTCNLPARLDLCHYGNAGVNILEAPGQRNLDFSLYKNFLIRENVKLQVRGEAFNASNTPFFAQPNGISFQTINSIVPDGPNDAKVTGLNGPMRIIQFALKISF